MQLDDYIRVLVRRWYIPVLFLAIAVFGAWFYNTLTATKTAASTLSVPLASLVAWDSVFNGQALPERVAERLGGGTTAEEIDNNIAGSFQLGSGRLTPTFAVRADDDNGDRAKLIARLTVEEGLILFEESQEARLEYVLAAFQEQIDEAEPRAVDARADLDRFLVENSAYSLTQRLAEQADLVANLRLQAELADIIGGGTASTEESPGLTEARVELDRLLELEPEYGQLQLEVNLAKASVGRLEAEIAALVVRGPGFATAVTVIEGQLSEAETRADHADNALADFRAEHSIDDLPTNILAQQSDVNDLLLAEVAFAGATSARGVLAVAEASLLQLESAQPEFNRLTRELLDAEALVSIRDNQETVIAQISPIEDQIEVVDNAELVSGLWWTMIRYAVSVMLALFLALIAVYLLALFEKRPPTIDELEQELGRSVLARIPKAS